MDVRLVIKNANFPKELSLWGVAHNDELLCPFTLTTADSPHDDRPCGNWCAAFDIVEADDHKLFVCLRGDFTHRLIEDEPEQHCPESLKKTIREAVAKCRKMVDTITGPGQAKPILDQLLKDIMGE